MINEIIPPTHLRKKIKQGAPTPLILITLFSTSQRPNETKNKIQELSVKCLNRVTSRIFIFENVNHKYGAFGTNY